jgi:ribosomal biogenesis protein LAS1
MVQYVTTPWRHRRDLLLVRDQLYPTSTTTHRRQAVARVAIWVQRGNCPHLVESTALLAAALLNDVPGNSSFCIRAAYATSFSRCVFGPSLSSPPTVPLPLRTVL